MKKISLIISLLLLVFIGFAQSPNQFKYQAVIRDVSGEIVANKAVTIDIEILKYEPAGESVFSETHNVTTTANGLVNLTIGSVNDLSAVVWEDEDYFIKVSIDGTEMGTSQLLSVPFALNANNAQKADTADYANIANFAEVATTSNYSSTTAIFSDIIEITGTTSSTLHYFAIPFPIGYNKTNTRVLSLEIGASNNGTGEFWRGTGTTVVNSTDGNVTYVGSVYSSISSNIYIYYPDVDDYKNKPFRIVIAKVE